MDPLDPILPRTRLLPGIAATARAQRTARDRERERQERARRRADAPTGRDGERDDEPDGRAHVDVTA